MKKIIYLDNNATTPVSEEVKEEILPFLEWKYGNPSSIHAKGREAKKHLEAARERLAMFFNCSPGEVVFTSCGSESNNLAIKGAYFSSLKKRRHIISCRTEHPSVINACESLKEFGGEITYLNVDGSGMIDFGELESCITENTILISIMLANNETGVINDIKKVTEAAARHDILVHTDAVQASGKMPIDVSELNVDMLSISGHKFHAPKGVGALYVKKGLALKSIIDGGGQESGMRAGTENLPYIAGLAKACDISRENMLRNHERMMSMKKGFFDRITSHIADVTYNGDFDGSLPNTINMSFKDVDVQSLLINLDLKGVMVSSGSACSSGAPKASHVLTAMNLAPELLKCALRISFSAYNTDEEVMRAADILIDTVSDLKNCK